MNGIQPSSCSRTRQWISLGLDGQLSEFERFLMDDHIGRCADCTAFERDLRRLTAGVRSTPLEKVSVPVRIEQPRHPARLGRVGLANVVSVAVTAASVFVAMTFLPERAGVVPSNDEALQIAVASDPMTVNELVLEVRRRNLQQQNQPAVRREPGDIGAVTAPLAN
jgi:Putative zinc-finger